MCYKPPFTAKKTRNPRPISTPPGMAVGCLGPRVPSSSLSIGCILSNDVKWKKGIEATTVRVLFTVVGPELDGSSTIPWLAWKATKAPGQPRNPEQMLIWIIFEIEKSSFTISVHVDCHLQKQWKPYSLPFISMAILLVIFMMHYTSNPANGHFSTHGLSILNQIYPIHTAICVRDTNLGRFSSYGDLPFHWWQ